MVAQIQTGRGKPLPLPIGHHTVLSDLTTLIANCNPKVILIRILNPYNKTSGLQTPKDEELFPPNEGKNQQKGRTINRVEFSPALLDLTTVLSDLQSESYFIRILNPYNKTSRLQTPKDEGLQT